MLSNGDLLHVVLHLVESPDVDRLQKRCDDLETALSSALDEVKRLQTELRRMSVYQIRLSRAIKAIRRLGGDPAIFGL